MGSLSKLREMDIDDVIPVKKNKETKVGKEICLIFVEKIEGVNLTDGSYNKVIETSNSLAPVKRHSSDSLTIVQGLEKNNDEAEWEEFLERKNKKISSQDKSSVIKIKFSRGS